MFPDTFRIFPRVIRKFNEDFPMKIFVIFLRSFSDVYFLNFLIILYSVLQFVGPYEVVRMRRPYYNIWTAFLAI